MVGRHAGILEIVQSTTRWAVRVVNASEAVPGAAVAAAAMWSPVVLTALLPSSASLWLSGTLAAKLTPHGQS